MGSQKNNRRDDKTLTKLLIVKAVIETLNIIIGLTVKLIDLLSN